MQKGRHLRTALTGKSAFVFLDEKDVDSTNNHAERMLRYAVIRQKRGEGTSSTKE
ncbi:IS66 family transposase [Desulfococcus multivorans]|uniref:IS66 family transposase n=1 Tax=Desulfococcus multivorans TaxID=897 RepID=UPI00338F1D65